VALILTRQKLPVLDRTVLAPAAGVAKGAYVLVDTAGRVPDVILIATGSEVALALDAHARLAEAGTASRVVSMPCWELFEAQPQSYRDAVLPPEVRARVSIEAAATFGWERYVGTDGASVGIDHFGASAPAAVLAREFRFTPERVIETARAVLARTRARGSGETLS
jgi:transketolase